MRQLILSLSLSYSLSHLPTLSLILHSLLLLQKELFVSKVEPTSPRNERKFSAATAPSMKTKWLKAFKSLKPAGSGSAQQADRWVCPPTSLFSFLPYPAPPLADSLSALTYVYLPTNRMCVYLSHVKAASRLPALPPPVSPLTPHLLFWHIPQWQTQKIVGKCFQLRNPDTNEARKMPQHPPNHPRLIWLKAAKICHEAAAATATARTV